MFNNETENELLLNVDTFIDVQTWYEVLKIEVAEALSAIKSISKLSYITHEPKMMCEVVRCLKKARHDILNATVIANNSTSANEVQKNLAI